MCYSTTDISKAHRSSCSQGEKDKEKKVHGFAYECYYCRKFFAQPDKKAHRNLCRHTLYINFNNQNLITLEENLKYRGDLDMIVYFDYETTATTNNCLNPEQRETFLISYLMIVAFQPGLKLNRIIIECSFGH